ncbi:MAG: hypothetical protein AVDCRST_MAG26-2721 [uncultured Chloroflexia bacterium]|uniref:Uncharacterized protein n=1 Tax=uncultured Chloroflexia bacterium TaxID=1672391 RepID=A0A6J4J673_9CHLR|nr:MAG: hypothetical protein AVDCRST_MAG26-2721 [uncultured Chloroflexia bacterium]
MRDTDRWERRSRAIEVSMTKRVCETNQVV